MFRLQLRLALIPLALALAACTTIPNSPGSPVPLASNVDLPRVMGDWYVIAHIPTFNDRDPYNALETYTLNDDGSIGVVYTTRQGGFDGEPKRMTPTGHVIPGSGNALWGMQFVPLVWAEYRIAHLEPDYSAMIVGRSELDHVWLMSRTPTMTPADFARHATLMASWGYDMTRLQRVPQRWPGQN